MQFFNGTIFSIILTILLGIVVTKSLAKANAKQVILSYVTEHSSKAGTPTMGGIVIIMAVVITGAIFISTISKPVMVAVMIALGVGVIGFLDDFIKVKFSRNLGLMPYQKIIAQSVLGGVTAVYCYSYTGGEMLVPFVNEYIILGKWSIPLVFIAFIALVNTTNLTDGLDGLAANSTLIFLGGIGVIIAIELLQMSGISSYGKVVELKGFLMITLATIGSVLAFLLFNTYPAKVFMGDTGSLFLGAIMTVLAVFTKNTFFILCFGLPFVVSGLSDILQVSYFKITKGKRIFKMAPFHHHLEECGIHENRIVRIYFIVSLVATLITLASYVGGVYGV